MNDRGLAPYEEWDIPALTALRQLLSGPATQITPLLVEGVRCLPGSAIELVAALQIAGYEDWSGIKVYKYLCIQG